MVWQHREGVSYFLPFVVLILFLTIFYLLAPHSYTPKLSHAVIAASLVTVLWLAATGVYSWLLLLIRSIGESYGPLFGLFVLFLWFRYITYIIIIGICFLKAWDNLWPGWTRSSHLQLYLEKPHVPFGLVIMKFEQKKR